MRDFNEGVKSALTKLEELEKTLDDLQRQANEVQMNINKYGKLFVTYESPFNDTIFSEKQMREIYRIMVDKEDYETFEIWLSDMTKSGVFEEFLPQK